MAEVTIYGSSDDLVEIDGDLSIEFCTAPYGDNEAVVLTFSNDVVVTLRYAIDGPFWRIMAVVPESLQVSLFKCSEETEERDNIYSDRFTMIDDKPIELVEAQFMRGTQLNDLYTSDWRRSRLYCAVCGHLVEDDHDEGHEPYERI